MKENNVDSDTDHIVDTLFDPYDTDNTITHKVLTVKSYNKILLREEVYEQSKNRLHTLYRTHYRKYWNSLGITFPTERELDKIVKEAAEIGRAHV